MDPNKEEALREKENAERRFAVKDFVGAKSYALRARSLYPELDGISQMVSTFNIYLASVSKVNGEIDFYSVLGLDPSADRSMVKKKYKKLAVLLHPDKNKTVGAEGAFKLVSEAWTLLSDSSKRASYDLKRNGQLSSSALVPVAAYTDGCSKPTVPPTFWTVCTSCHVQYEYLRKYVNKRLSCKNCRATFVAVELGTAPMNGAYPVNSWPPSYGHDNGYGSSHGYNGVSYYSSSGVYVAGGGAPAFHSGHGSEYNSNMSFQWGASTGTSSGYVDGNGYPTGPADINYHKNSYRSKPATTVKVGPAAAKTHVVADLNFANGTSSEYNRTPVMKTTRPYKKRKVEPVSGVSTNGNEVGANNVSASTVRNVNDNGISNRVTPKVSDPFETARRQAFMILPSVDCRTFLFDKAKRGITKKLEEMKSAAAAAPAQKKTVLGSVGGNVKRTGRRPHQDIPILGTQRSEPVILVVPDPDFHDFDKDRTEECFKPKQIWALYDEEDGMPRLYCLIRQVISVNPFKMHISYLSSRTDSEFGVVNWIQYGFTKSCGNFRPFSCDVVDQVNMFSHLLSKEKAGRGGCVRIYPRGGDVWAVYRNWSPKWNSSTPCEVRHQYEMVEVLEDHSDELGVWVTPLVKLEGFKTVYQRNSDKSAVRWIPRREMLRFSHQVPSWLLQGEKDLPDGCWDLDPAAMPEELLQEAGAQQLSQDAGVKQLSQEAGEAMNVVEGKQSEVDS